ncbi:MAG TPA: hypothetical protein VIX82_03875 [Solirubrobacteraceae bacterium]
MTPRLEQQLLVLGAALEMPAAPDVVPAVIARLPTRRRRRGRPARRPLAIALAALLLLAGAAMAVPPTRNAILRVLGLRGVRIERVTRLPALPPGAGARLGLGMRIPLARARHAASFAALLPANASAVYLGHEVPGGRISLLVGKVLIIEFRGTATPFIFKVLGPGTTVKQVRINGEPGLYLFGAPHHVFFEDQSGGFQTDRVRLAGNVLIWQQGPVTVRIEGTHTLAKALAITLTLR